MSGSAVLSAALGNFAVDTAKYGVKNIFNPSSLPATRGDNESLSDAMKIILRSYIMLKSEKEMEWINRKRRKNS